MNKIAVVSMVKNEIDIIESFIRHTCKFADKIFICDHKSTDGTREIIEALANELPIELSTFERDEFALADMINSFKDKAFESEFDLVIPLDADEFLLMIGGNSKDLREHLQNLDPKTAVKSYLWEYRFADDNIEKFALSRKVLQMKQMSKTTKVIVGREFSAKYKIQITQGNHDLKLPDGTEILLFDKNSPLIPRDEKIIHAHFSERSSEQLISKHMIQWLNTELKATRYTPWASHSKRFSNYYLKDESVAKIDLSEYVPADLELYKNECNLDKNGGGYENKSSSKCFHARRKFFSDIKLRKNFSKE